MNLPNPETFLKDWHKAMTIETLATLRAAFHAGATIQAYTVENDDGSSPMWRVEKLGYWRDLCNLGAEPKFSCHPSRYQVKYHHPAEAPVADLRQYAGDAVSYSHNFANAKPNIGRTEREHILGLCRLVEKLIGCGACGDGCRGGPCRLECESPNPAEAPVAWEYRSKGSDEDWVRGEGTLNADYDREHWEVRKLYTPPDPEVTALLIRLNEAEAAAEVNSMRASVAQDECDALRAEVERLRHDNEVQMGALVAQGRTIGRVRALADEIEYRTPGASSELAQKILAVLDGA